MNSAELLSRLCKLNIKLWLEGDRLRYRAPNGVMTPPLRAELVERRAEVIAFLRQAQENACTILPAIQPVPHDGPLPLSFAQQRLWFLDQFEPNSPAYNMFAALGLTGSLNIAALERSINEIVRRHKALRTNFVTQEGHPVQVIAPRRKIPMPLVDLRMLAKSERETRVKQLARQEAQKPFDLTCDPLLRTRLLKLDQSEHVLLLTIHHIVSDGWSLGILAQELTQLYQAFSTGQPSPLPELPVQYADFAVWQREWLQGDVLQAQLDYWKQKLRGGIPTLGLPTDRPRPAIQTFRGARQPFTLPLAKELKALSQREGATLFMTLLTAFKILLYRYTGQTNIAVGAPIANRQWAEIEGLIGFFVNTLVLQTDLTGELRFRDLLARVREITLGAFAHQDVPFERLVDELQPERSLSHSPLFQVMFVLHNLPATTLELPDLTLSHLNTDGSTAQFDLTLSVVETESELLGELEYNTDLFDQATILRLIEHFQTLLAGIVDKPNQRISELPLLTKAQEKQLLHAWSGARRDLSRKACTHELFEAQAARTPDKTAIVVPAGQTRSAAWLKPRTQLTFRELNAYANQLAHHLQDLGVGPEVIVSIYLENSLEAIVAMLATLKAGGAYLPLDPSCPPERLAFMLSDACSSVLITQSQLLSQIADVPASVSTVCLDQTGATLFEKSGANPISGAVAENSAYVIYTSGSTGRPKGVLVPHRALVNHSLAAADHYNLKPDDRVLQFASISFDVAAEEIFPTWLCGAAVVLGRDQALTLVTDLIQFVKDHQITALNLPTPYWHEWVSELPHLPLSLPTTLRLVVVGSEKALPDKLASWQKHIDGQVEWYNAYGPTEATITTTIYDPSQAESEISGHVSVPIGRPIPNTQVYVLDQKLNPVPIGVPGELYIGGEGLARGYLDRPGLTAKRFVPHPFGKEPGGRLYATGDLVRWLPDGNLDFLGRRDHQVKVRGFRVELGEIEAVLGEHPAVKENVVLAWDAPGGENDLRLVAYLVCQDGQAAVSPPTPTELRGFLKQKLPDYMLPSHFVFLAAMPLTPSGKLDRRALPAPERARPELNQAFAAPRSPIEEALVAVWAQVLGLEGIGIHDSFFELGGHSLLATQVISRLRDILQVELPLRSLFEAPTVSKLAKRVESLSRKEPDLQAPPIVSISHQGELPLSFAQQRLWFMDQLAPGNPSFNMFSAVRLDGRLDNTALERSIGEIVQRHQTLRTTFVSRDGQPAQIIAPTLDVPLPVVNLQSLPQDERESRVRQLAAEEVRRPFDLSQGPLIRATLLKLKAEEHVLFLNVHHIVSDGWSLGVFVRELMALYRAFVHKKPSPLPELPVQYADFALWQREWLQGPALETQLAYWRERLDGAPTALELPTDHPRPAIQSHRGAAHSFDLSLELTRKLKALSQQEGVTLFMTLLAGFKTLLCRYTGQTDIVVGSPIAGRNRSEIEGLIGFFVNNLVLRTDLGENPSFQVLLGRVRDAALGAYAHQDLPFEKLVDELQPERRLSHTPLFQVMFALQNTPMEKLELPGLKLSPVTFEPETAKFDLTLFMADTDQGLTGGIVYNRDLFEPATMARMTGHFENLLKDIAAHPHKSLSELSLLTRAERSQLLKAWNNTQASYPQERCFHELFAEQADHTPDNVAVVFGDQRLTYQELNRRANQVAHYLQALGVAPDELVGICIERSLDMVIALLGVLKAGGGYVPLDPTYPPERLAFMLTDTQTSVVLTQHSLVDGISVPGVETVCIDTDWPMIAQHNQENPTSEMTAENLAYVIYTSGSTGKPKGVLIPHRGLVNYLTWCVDAYRVAEGPGSLVHSSLGFDLTVTSLLSPLVVGQRLVMLPEGGELESLSGLLGTPGALSLVKITPAHLNALNQLLPTNGTIKFRGAFVIGGEALGASTLFFWRTRAPYTRLINEYGPTESVVGCCVYEVTADAPESGPVPIGQPIANTQIYLLDAHLQPVPMGVPGELYVGGHGLARGYLNRPELTAQQFIPNPFSQQPGTRLYKTGDLARYLPDGNIEFIGRTDHQVKVRGFRIELGEIEVTLGQYDGVAEAVVVARQDETGAGSSQHLIAYVVPDQESVISPGELRRFVREKLPDYMVPSAFVSLEKLPLTPNGKIDRAALPPPDQSRPEQETGFVAPRNATEETLTDIFAAVLRLDQVGIYDNFFELGGHSLLATQVVSRIRGSFQLEVPLQALFETPTVAGLAETIVQQEIEQTDQELLTQLLDELD